MLGGSDMDDDEVLKVLHQGKLKSTVAIHRERKGQQPRGKITMKKRDAESVSSMQEDAAADSGSESSDSKMAGSCQSKRA